MTRAPMRRDRLPSCIRAYFETMETGDLKRLHGALRRHFIYRPSDERDPVARGFPGVASMVRDVHKIGGDYKLRFDKITPIPGGYLIAARLNGKTFPMRLNDRPIRYGLCVRFEARFVLSDGKLVEIAEVKQRR